MADGIDPSHLVATHQREVWWYLRYLGCDPSLADDLTQDVFLGVLRAGSGLENRACAVRDWSRYLRSAAHHAFISHWRRNKREVVLDIEGDDLDRLAAYWGETMADSTLDDALDALRRCLETLEAREKQAVDLAYGEQRGRGEIALELDVSREAAKKIVQRGLSKLGDCVRQRMSGHA